MTTPSTGTATRSRWLLRRQPRPAAALRLYCFPHSGGSAGEYLRWSTSLPGVEVWGLQPPGPRQPARGATADDDARPRRRHPRGGGLRRSPYAFFGHSLGALVAYETALALRDRGLAGPTGTAPVGLRRAAPSTARGRRCTSSTDRACSTRSSGSTARCRLSCTRTPSCYRPRRHGLRADLSILATYQPTQADPLACPLTVLGGSDDDGDARAPAGLESPTRPARSTCGSSPATTSTSGSSPMTSSDFLAAALASSAPSCSTELYRGRVRWDLLAPFPEQDAADRRARRARARSARRAAAPLDRPGEVDDIGRLPDGFLDDCRMPGCPRLTDPTRARRPRSVALSTPSGSSSWRRAGRCRSPSRWPSPTASAPASYLPALPDGPLKDMISARVAAGDRVRRCRRRGDRHRQPAAHDGRCARSRTVSAYVITGEKVFIGNGPVADLMDVSATVVGDDGSEGGPAVLRRHPTAPGSRSSPRHEFMGLRGAAIGALRLDGVRVPAEHLLVEDGSDGWRMRPGPRRHRSGRRTRPPDLAGWPPSGARW